MIKYLMREVAAGDYQRSLHSNNARLSYRDEALPPTIKTGYTK
ncbi:hypothetical protein [Nostoc sp.]